MKSGSSLSLWASSISLKTLSVAFKISLSSLCNSSSLKNGVFLFISFITCCENFSESSFYSEWAYFERGFPCEPTVRSLLFYDFISSLFWFFFICDASMSCFGWLLFWLKYSLIAKIPFFAIDSFGFSNFAPKQWNYSSVLSKATDGGITVISV